MQKLEHNPIPVYIITKTGVGFNDEGIQAAADLIFSDEGRTAGPAGQDDSGATGILAFTGKHLLDPKTLAAALRETPDGRVIISKDQAGGMILCGYGPDDMGLPGVIRVLDDAESGTSWEILMEAAKNGK